MKKYHSRQNAPKLFREKQVLLVQQDQNFGEKENELEKSSTNRE